ncbi:hypothetical protein CERSUDRAFT_114102 [Gelatoporia subvermispora B]|uniref:Uncharacterized protein n=1 Tax=Ceriporiopsis subvermispora (strain B) TaxID=914234 RepID=M2RF89_CERS8|nr:hypothetical protein CERSUDRAFT_114102 [Gelatoporia subvermispora B]
MCSCGSRAQSCSTPMSKLGDRLVLLLEQMRQERRMEHDVHGTERDVHMRAHVAQRKNAARTADARGAKPRWISGITGAVRANGLQHGDLLNLRQRRRCREGTTVAMAGRCGAAHGECYSRLGSSREGTAALAAQWA